jgi:hypothetical protein
VKTHEPLVEDSKQRTFHGRIESTEPDSVHPDDDHEGTVVIRDDDGEFHRIGMHEVRRANLVYDAHGEGRNEG